MSIPIIIPINQIENNGTFSFYIQNHPQYDSYRNIMNDLLPRVLINIVIEYARRVYDIQYTMSKYYNGYENAEYVITSSNLCNLQLSIVSYNYYTGICSFGDGGYNNMITWIKRDYYNKNMIEFFNYFMRCELPISYNYFPDCRLFDNYKYTLPDMISTYRAKIQINDKYNLMIVCMIIKLFIEKIKKGY